MYKYEVDLKSIDLKGTQFGKRFYIIEVYISMIWSTIDLESIRFGKNRILYIWTLYKYNIWKWFEKVLYDIYFRSKGMESAFCLISALWPHRGFILSILFSLIFGFPDVILECSHRGVTHGFFSLVNAQRNCLAESCLGVRIVSWGIQA